MRWLCGDGLAAVWGAIGIGSVFGGVLYSVCVSGEGWELLQCERHM